MERTNTITVRRAREADIHQICSVVRASIEQLCVLDHKGDPEILRLWLANKTPENVGRWIANPDNMMLVSVDGSLVLGAACVTNGGVVVLNYVSPAWRFRGVGSGLLASMEAAAKQVGNSHCTLDSTATARDFYRSRGYSDTGSAGAKFGLTTYPMAKAL